MPVTIPADLATLAIPQAAAPIWEALRAGAAAPKWLPQDRRSGGQRVQRPTLHLMSHITEGRGYRKLP